MNNPETLATSDTVYRTNTKNTPPPSQNKLTTNKQTNKQAKAQHKAKQKQK